MWAHNRFVTSSFDVAARVWGRVCVIFLWGKTEHVLPP